VGNLACNGIQLQYHGGVAFQARIQDLGLDKEYEVEVLFGVTTDTSDLMGVLRRVDLRTQVYPAWTIGKFTQEYPPYSSRTVDGVALHELARADKLPKEMPTNEVEIYSIEDLGTRHITGNKIAEYAIENIRKVLGDFRQEEIISGWNNFQGKYGNESFSVLKIKVRCSSGTYMRSLASRMGQDVGTGALAMSIKRTWIDYPQQ
jgi:tRNA pseudouridine(55) synthase